MECVSCLILAAWSFSNLYSIALAVVGLGLVIFFHELGHFAVAKWCNVQVERFSIGFGPILWSRKWGETEYALSAIPFGGYVKMLGQDDLDPSQLSSEDIARNPRSYSAKSVAQRMAIISAGVIMNVVTAVLFFGIAFSMGIEQEPPIVGGLTVGKPAWVAGMRQGDRITSINGRTIDSFGDVTRAVALSSGEVQIDGVRTDGQTYSVSFKPDRSGTRREIGVRSTASLTLATLEDPEASPTFPGSPAAAAKPTFRGGDTIHKVDGVEVSSFTQLQGILARRRSETLKFEVVRGKGDAKKTETITIAPNPFRTLGLWMDIGRILTVQKDSPAEKAGLQIDDKITRVGDLEVGTDFNPLLLPDKLWELRDQEVTITVVRSIKGAESKEVSVTLIPEDRPGWTEQPSSPDTPLSVPSIGVGVHIVGTVVNVEPGSPAEKAKIAKRDRVKVVELVKQAGSPKDGFAKDVVTIPLTQKDDATARETNWAYAFWMIQQAPTRVVKLTLSDISNVNSREVILEPTTTPVDDWYSPVRGFVLDEERITLKAESFPRAASLGFSYTRNTIVDLYLTLRSLLTGDVSVRELQGPVGIAKVAYSAASQGIPYLLAFLGLLSVNLAVINFLPIPVLDGGHMVFLIWEAVTRRKPSERVLIAAQYFGMAFVLSLMLAVIYLDLFVHKL